MQILLTVLSLFSFNLAEAAVCSRTITFADGSVLTAAQLNAEFNAITNCANSLNDSNIASSAAILPEKISATIAGTALTRDGSSGVLSVGVDDSTIETNSDAIRVKDLGITAAKLAADSVTTAKILDSNVTTAKIADGSITQAKRAALNYQISSSSGTFTTTSPSFTDVTNLSVTITTTGRPVYLGVMSDGDSTSRGAILRGICSLRIMRGASDIAYMQTWPTSSIPLTTSMVSHLDVPSAGTYTYKIQVTNEGSPTSCEFLRSKFYAYEL
jgi:hypothetical protein